MATNLSIDERLLAEAKELGRFKTKRETVNTALQEFIQHYSRVLPVSLFRTAE